MQEHYCRAQADFQSNQSSLPPAAFCIMVALQKRWAWFISTVSTINHLPYTTVPSESQLEEQPQTVRGALQLLKSIDLSKAAKQADTNKNSLRTKRRGRKVLIILDPTAFGGNFLPQNSGRQGKSKQLKCPLCLITAGSLFM